MRKPDVSLLRGLLSHRPHRIHRAGLTFFVLILALSLLLGQGAALALRPVEDTIRPAARPQAASLSVTKTMVSPVGRTTVYGGEEVVFDIEVRNTGDVTVGVIPQEDIFDTVCLQFKEKASPPESSYDNSLGLVEWTDLTVSNNSDLAPGQSFVTRVTFTVPTTIPGGAHNGYNTARVAGAKDINSNTVPTAETTINVTCAERPLLALDKSFSVPRTNTVLLTGQPISFTISLTNTGPTTLGYIPLTDLFDDSCLTFVSKASPPESDVLGNLIQWEDLTLSFNSDLPPGQSFAVTLNFQVTGPPTGQPVRASQNVASVQGALDLNAIPAPDVQDTVLYSCAAPASIGDYVWNDLNGNGLQDEPAGSGLNGVTVYLYLDDGDGVFEPGGDDVLVATEVTSGDGGYLFDMLHAGDYWVDVDQTTVPAGLTLTTGTDPLPVTVAYGQAYLTADFGYTGADVSIVKTDALDPVVVGGVLTYTLSVHNAGPSAALNVIVTDTLPAGLSFVAADPTQTSGPNPLTWHLGTLAAGASQTIVVTTTVSAPAGSTLVNAAEVTTDSSDPRPDNNRDTETTLIVKPAIQIVKTVSLDGQCPGSQSVAVLSGTQVTYCYEVTNTGDTYLSAIGVTDDKLGAICTIPLLAPNASQTCMVTAAITADTTNVGTATGQPANPQSQALPGIGPVEDEDDAVVEMVLDFGDAPDPSYPTLLASNGARHVIVPNVFLGALVDGELDGQPTLLADGDDLNPAAGPDDEDGVAFLTPLIQGQPAQVQVVASVPGFLNAWFDFNGDGDWADAGEWVFVDQALVAGLNVLNIPVPSGAIPGPTYARFRFSMVDHTTAGYDYRGLAPDGEVEDYLVEIVASAPALTLDKSTATANYDSVGDVISYSYVVTNSGNVPLTPPYAVSDDKTTVSCPQTPSPLNPGQSITCTATYVVTQADITAGAVTNVATASALYGNAPVQSNQDTETVPAVQTPALDIQKTPDVQQISVGGTATFTITVTNTGNVPLAPVVVSDLLAPNCDQTFASLALGAVQTYTCTAANVQADFTNAATATGTPPVGPDVTDSDTAFVDVLRPAIRIVKTPSATQVPPGTLVTYIYAASNIGDVPLANVVVTDDKCSPVKPIPPSGNNVGDVNGNGLLDLGETWQYQCSATLTEDTLNTATVTADDPLGKPVTDDDVAFVDVLRPGFQIDKTASATVVYAGTVVQYTYTVTNTSSDPVYNVQVSDDTCSPVTYQGGDTNNNNRLDPGETWTYTCSATLLVDTKNVATVTGRDALGNPVPPDQASAEVNVINPAIQVVKTADPAVVLSGGTVVYTYVVTNPGDDPLSNVTVSDDKCSPVTPVLSGGFNVGDLDQDGLLDPGETWRFTCTAHPTEDTTNTATATGDDSLGNPVDDTDTAFVDVVDPAIHIEKTATPAVVLPGGQVVYTYAVTNPGDVPLVNVTVSDDKCSPVTEVTSGSFNVGDTDKDDLLDPGEAWQFTCTTTVSIDTTNTAIATGQPADGQGNALPGIGPVSDDDTAFVDVVDPRINVEKTADPTVIHSGDSVIYTYVVTNPGDVPLVNVTVSDDKCSPVTEVTSGSFNVGDTDKDDLLDPGEAWQFTCTTTVSMDTTNTATATGQPADGQGNALPGIGPVSDDDTAFVDVLNPQINVVKSGPAIAFVGETVTYTYTVTNTGDTPLSDVAVSDDVCGQAAYVSGDANGNGVLDLNETWLFKCTYTVVPGDPDPLVNVATAQGQDALGLVVRDDDTHETDLVIGRIGDTAWVDADGEGDPDLTEPRLANVPITLTGTNIYGNPVNLTATTTITGYYMFENLLPGAYTVTAPAVFGGFQLTTPSAGGYNVTLTTAAPQELDADFGYKPPTSVTVFNFAAAVVAAGAGLQWEAYVPQGTLAPAFHVYRTLPGGTTWMKLTTDAPVGPVSLGGDILEYTFTDAGAQLGSTYQYKLVDAEDPDNVYGPYTVMIPNKTQRVFLPLLLR